VTLALIHDTDAGCALEECPWLAKYPLRAPRSRAGERARLVADVAVAVALLLFALPVMALAALAVKVTSPRGPVFFVQDRTGYHGHPFRLFKLRTMVPDADALKAELAHLNARQWPDFKIERDPRITRVGRFLRATSIDELPQLFNVVRGDMALVGPRPTSLQRDGYAPWQYERFDVRPGLTGLWQISARDTPSFDHRLRLDIAYSARRSWRLDLAILVRTVPVVLFGRGAL
jgi:lipopolysaccharide/colanic/teichoic acid biosynthesis glycosyltransferase